MTRTRSQAVVAMAVAALVTSVTATLATTGTAAAVPPPACGDDDVTATYTQSTPTAIPAGPSVATSTIVVSGAGTFLADVDLLTNLVHTFSNDLDMTLTSPAGTIVTLSTDNGGNNDNVFNGTVWDDDANPAGQVPYVNNDGVVTDNVYVNLTTAPTLTPEEPLGAFVGEDPNGTWTMTISDDLAGDAGSLDSWALTVTTLPSAPLTAIEPTATQATPLAVPVGPAVVSSTLVVAGVGTYLADVDLTTGLAHTFGTDLDMTLASPAGTVVTLSTDNGAGHDNVFNGTVWDDSADPAGQVPYSTNDGVTTDHAYANLTPVAALTPEEPLAAFIGENPNGTWTITISDDLSPDGGTLNSWSLNLDTAACDSPPAPDNAVTGAKVKAKKQKVTLTKFKVKTEVRATAEALTAAVTGKVKVKLANGKNATYKLGKVTKNAPLGGKAKLKQQLTGSKAKAAAARAAMVDALKAKRSVVVKLKFTIRDAAGNKQVVKKTVKVKRG